MVKDKKKLNIVSRGLIGIGNVVDSGIKKVQENQRYKQSPEYKQKVLNDLAYQQKIQQQRIALMKQQSEMQKLRQQNPQQNPFGGFGMWGQPQQPQPKIKTAIKKTS
jgi:hypothetical protein